MFITEILSLAFLGLIFGLCCIRLGYLAFKEKKGKQSKNRFGRKNQFIQKLFIWKKCIVLLAIGIATTCFCFSILFLFFWMNILPALCTDKLPMNFVINSSGKSDEEVAREVFSRYLDHNVFPHSCPSDWITHYSIDRMTHELDTTWSVEYITTPFPGNWGLSGNQTELPNGDISQLQFFTLKKEGNIYTIMWMGTGG